MTLAILALVTYGWVAFAAGPFAPGATLDPVADFPSDCSGPTDGDCFVTTGWQINTADGYVYNDTDMVGIGTDTPTRTLDIDGDFKIYHELDSRFMTMLAGDLTDLGGEKGFGWYTGNGTDITALLTLDENSDNPELSFYVSDGVDALQYTIQADGLVLDGGNFVAEADENANGLTFSAAVDREDASLTGGNAGGTKNGYISVLDDGAGNPEVWISYTDANNDHDIRLNSNTAGISTTDPGGHFSSYFNLNTADRVSSWDTNFPDYDVGTYFGSGENSGVPLILMQNNNLATNIGYGFSAFPHNATFFRCNTNYPDIVGPGCNDDRAVYVTDDNVSSFVWTDDSIDNSNKNINSVTVTVDQIKLYFEEQTGTPTTPGRGSYFTLNDNILAETDNLDIDATKFGFTGNTDTDYVGKFFNDGNNANRYGIQVQAGADDASGTTYYLNALDGNGDQVGYIANTSGTFALTDISDRRTKTNIEDASLDGLNIINQLRVVDFNRIQNTDGPTITGFIAQEVRDVYPEAITVAPNGYLGIMKDAFIPVLVKAIQELDLKVADIETIATMQNATFVDSLRNWLADAGNGIVDLFAKRVTTTELCVADDAGTTCLTRAQILGLIDSSAGAHETSGGMGGSSSDASGDESVSDLPSDDSIEESPDSSDETPEPTTEAGDASETSETVPVTE